jgi:hypothetical protein
MSNMNDFINYVHSFYGTGGIYDMGATKNMIEDATSVRIKTRKDIAFQMDSVDRELVRDIMIDLFYKEVA